MKTLRFKKPTYIGDPINAVRIFNDKEVDELIILDTSATIEGRRPNFNLLEGIAGEAFMPFGYGGGIKNLDDVRTLLKLGVEKVIINSYAMENPSFVREAVSIAGAQSVVISVDARKSVFGKFAAFSHSGQKRVNRELRSLILQMQELGAGEVILTSIDRDGTMTGYDLALISEISNILTIPLVACGGAGTPEDFRHAVQAGASAVAAGSMFVFHGHQRAVLISYPEQKKLRETFATS